MAGNKVQKQNQLVPGAPDYELARSPAASRVGKLAAQSGLFMAHYEYRVDLDPPEHWLPENRPDLGERLPWTNGILPEAKYQRFRNDLMIGSFHPGHRAKWTAHELCHGLVGFAWKPGGSRFFNALSARLTELLPVALFYFFDEVCLNRCAAHQDLGPLFAVFCDDCEEAAKEGPRSWDPNREKHLGDGRAFIERELGAIHRSLKTGHPIASPWGSLDLCSDGLAYAAAQHGRLSSPEYASFIEKFYPSGTGRHKDLHALEERIRVLTAFITGASDEAPPWPVSRNTWMRRDLGWRLWEIRAQVDGPAGEGLDRLIDVLTGGGEESIIEASVGYQSLFEEYTLPEPEDVFAVGYPLPGEIGRSARQIGEGIASACPLSHELLGDENARLLHAFTQADENERVLLGRRWAAWLVRHRNDLPAQVAAFEAAVVHAPARDAAAESLGGQPDAEPRLNSAVRLHETSWEVLDFVGIRGIRIPGEEQQKPLLAIRRDVNGEPGIYHLEPHLAALLRALQRGDRPVADEDTWRGLVDQGLVAPIRWHS